MKETLNKVFFSKSKNLSLSLSLCTHCYQGAVSGCVSRGGEDVASVFSQRRDVWTAVAPRALDLPCVRLSGRKGSDSTDTVSVSEEHGGPL